MLVIAWHEYSMLKLIFNKDDSLFFYKKKLASSRGAPLEYDRQIQICNSSTREFGNSMTTAK